MTKTALTVLLPRLKTRPHDCIKQLLPALGGGGGGTRVELGRHGDETTVASQRWRSQSTNTHNSLTSRPVPLASQQTSLTHADISCYKPSHVIYKRRLGVHGTSVPAGYMFSEAGWQ